MQAYAFIALGLFAALPLFGYIALIVLAFLAMRRGSEFEGRLRLGRHLELSIRLGGRDTSPVVAQRLPSSHTPTSDDLGLIETPLVEED